MSNKLNNINKQQIFYTIQAENLANLDADVQLSSKHDIVDIADKIENKIPEIIRSTILNCANFIHNNTATKTNKLYSFVINEKHYEIVVQKDIINSTIFNVAFVNRDFKMSNLNYIEKDYKLIDCGQFETLKLFIPNRTAIDTDFIHEIVQVIFSSCYNWLQQKIYELTKENCIAASSLYSYIRKISTIDEHWKNIWFFTIKDDIAFYLIDKSVLENGIKQNQTISKQVDRSPLRLVSEILIMKLPIHESNAKKALLLGKCIDLVIEDSIYAEKRALLTAAEIGLYGSNSVSIFPVMNEGNNLLLAAFPTKYRKDIEPVLELHKENIQEQFRYFNSKILSVWNKLKSRNREIQYGPIGEFFGGVLKAFTA